MKHELQKKIDQVRVLLETGYHLDMNTVEKIASDIFTLDTLPVWYLHCKTPEEIARHLFIMTQLMNADDEHLTEVSDNGKEITYFVNVGRDFPGKLKAILEENRDIDFISFDSIKLSSGIRIVSLIKRYFDTPGGIEIDAPSKAALLQSVREHAQAAGYSHTEEFLSCLNDSYYDEELNSVSNHPRMIRHLDIYEQLLNGKDFLYTQDTCIQAVTRKGPAEGEEIRITLAGKSSGQQFPITVLELLKQLGLNLSRSYFDLLDSREAPYPVEILSLYFAPGTDTEELMSSLRSFSPDITAASVRAAGVHTRLEQAVRTISRKDLSAQELAEAVGTLKELTAWNKDVSDPHEPGIYLLNSFSDFFDALSYLGLDENPEVIRTLIGYDAFDEFWVETKHRGEIRNTEGFRTKHNSRRGMNKGGIRIDMIVEFSEVAALSFMMTWKCARSKILFGGGKGGLKIDPKSYGTDEIDFFDTLTNFGRALFMVTGPARDVPAGDVGCGGKEIGHMFEGFKSALRDIALIANGMKQTSAFMGNKVVSLRDARAILKNHFDVDHQDTQLLNEMIANEKYLELVAAPQITGKPRMGIQARTGATGRGLCYAILSTVSNEYLSGTWEAAQPLSAEEDRLLVYMQSVNEEMVLKKGGDAIFTEQQWTLLEQEIFPKLLKQKRVMVQGSGKVGSSVMQELDRFGISICGVADRDGAIYGDALDLEEMLREVKRTGTVFACTRGVQRKREGIAGGKELLCQPCDILILAALENTVTVSNVNDIRASVIACGSNGPNTSKAEVLLRDKQVAVVYDFLANGAGVTASYFEWLRNLSERFRYEAEHIKNEAFTLDCMDQYIMPEYRARIKDILSMHESEETTALWNTILRDIMISAVNDDYTAAKEMGVSMKTAGFVNSQLRVLAATLVQLPCEKRGQLWTTLSDKTQNLIRPFLEHPEIELYTCNKKSILKDLYPDS